MYKLKNLNRKNIGDFYKLNEERIKFNFENEDFFKCYNKSNFFAKIFLRNKVKFICDEDTYVGYIFFNKKDYESIDIRSLYVKDFLSQKALDYFKFTLDSFKNITKYSYKVQNNAFNVIVLKELNFYESGGTFEMFKSLKTEDMYEISLPDNIKFQNLVKGEHERIRCKIQNEIFNAYGRIPLSVNDIIFDELQSYYLKDCAVFIKSNDEYIGYGQIIIEKSNPYIVNLGILKDYRGHGFGKLLLKKLINIAISHNYKKVYINVNVKNNVAINLYTSFGFEKIKECSDWELKK